MLSNMTNGGFLVAVEGIDGAGKSSVLRNLAQFGGQLGWEIVQSREPTLGPWGRRLRESAREGRLSLEEELDLFVKDRREHVEAVIAPGLARGAMVLLDRYYLSTAAYQGARGADPEAVLALNEAFAPQPHLALLLDLSPDVSLQRVRSRGVAPDAFETLEQLQAVRSIFTALDRPFIKTVDANRSAELVAEECRSLIAAALACRAQAET